jgi:hypothetical protein
MSTVHEKNIDELLRSEMEVHADQCRWMEQDSNSEDWFLSAKQKPQTRSLENTLRRRRWGQRRRMQQKHTHPLNNNSIKKHKIETTNANCYVCVCVCLSLSLSVVVSVCVLLENAGIRKNSSNLGIRDHVPPSLTRGLAWLFLYMLLSPSATLLLPSPQTNRQTNRQV